MKLKLKLIPLIILVSAFEAACTTIDSNVGILNINQEHEGVFVELVNENNSRLVVDESCGNSNWVFFKLDSEINKAKLSVLVAAKATGSKVKALTRGCYESANTPILLNIQLL